MCWKIQTLGLRGFYYILTQGKASHIHHKGPLAKLLPKTGDFKNTNAFVGVASCPL